MEKITKICDVCRMEIKPAQISSAICVGHCPAQTIPILRSKLQTLPKDVDMCDKCKEVYRKGQKKFLDWFLEMRKL